MFKNIIRTVVIAMFLVCFNAAHAADRGSDKLTREVALAILQKKSVDLLRGFKKVEWPYFVKVAGSLYPHDFYWTVTVSGHPEPIARPRSWALKRLAYFNAFASVGLLKYRGVQRIYRDWANTILDDSYMFDIVPDVLPFSDAGYMVTSASFQEVTGIVQYDAVHAEAEVTVLIEPTRPGVLIGKARRMVDPTYAGLQPTLRTLKFSFVKYDDGWRWHRGY